MMSLVMLLLFGKDLCDTLLVNLQTNSRWLQATPKTHGSLCRRHCIEALNKLTSTIQLLYSPALLHRNLSSFSHCTNIKILIMLVLMIALISNLFVLIPITGLCKVV